MNKLSTFKFLFLLFLSLWSIESIQAQSDDCATALELTDLEDWCSANAAYTNVGSTSAHTLSNCWTGAESNNDVWFKFTAIGAAVNISIDGSGTGGGTLNRPQLSFLHEADLDCAGGGFANDNCGEGAAGNVSLYASGLTIGDVYYIRIDGRANNTGTFKLCINNFNPPVLPGQDCGTAASLCDKSTITQPILSGYGTAKETAGTCMSNSDNNSVWYTWTAADNGTMTFMIEPLIPGDDFDWVLFELPGGDCNSKSDIRCNASSCDPAAGANTGLLTGSGNNSVNFGCAGFSEATYQAALVCSPVTMTAGMTYGLIINNWTDASVGQNNGFNLSFGGTGEFQGPTADFDISTAAEYCIGDDITFTDASTNGVNDWDWDFGADASTGTATTQGAHTVSYSTPGTKTIVLTGGNGDCTDVIFKTIEVITCCVSPPVVTNPGNQSACDSYTLPASSTIGGSDLNDPLYYTNSQALGGTQITNLTISNTQTVWIYDSSGASCEDEESFVVTINDTEDATFSLSPNCSGSSATVTGTGGGTFAFNPSPGGSLSINSSTGAVTGGSSGNTYTVQYTTPGTCSASSTQTTTVSYAEDASFNTTATCDGGTATVTGTGGGTFAFNPSPGGSVSINSSTGTVTNGSSGATYTVEYTTSGTCSDSETQAVTVLTNDVTTFNTTPSCDGGTATITGTTGGTFALNPAPGGSVSIDSSTGTITGGTSGATYTIEYTTSGTCPASSTETVTASTQDNPSFSMVPTCDGGTATLTGTTGGAFAFNPAPGGTVSINSSTGAITGGTSGATYTVEYSTTGICAASSTEQVTVTTTDNPAFTVTPTCDGATATITGTSGGAFAFNPAPGGTVSIDGATGEITGGTSGETYTIEYTTAGTCPDNSTQDATVIINDDASFATTSTCDGGTSIISGTTGGTFSFNPIPGGSVSIDSSTGEVTGGTSDETYTIEYTTLGTCPKTSTGTVTVLTNDVANFTLSPTCDGGTATILATTGGSFAFNPTPTDGATIDNITGTVAGGGSGLTYTVEYTTLGLCPAVLTQDVTVNTTDDATFTATSTCDGATVLVTGTTGGTFTLNPLPSDATIIDATTGVVTNGTSEQTYSIEYTTLGICPSNLITDFTVITEDDATFSTEPTCDGGISTIEGTQGGLFSFNTVPADGANLDVNTGIILNGSSDSTYTIDYTTQGLCPQVSTQSVTVASEEDATFTLASTCDGAEATLLGTLGGVFTFDVTPVDGAILDSSSGTITGGTSEATYFVEYTTQGFCAESLVQNVIVTRAAVAGTDGEVSLCSSDASINLEDYIIGEDLGGTWTYPNGTTHTGVLAPSSDLSGQYSYTVAGITPCPNATAIVDVTVDTAVNSGTGGSQTSCTNDAQFNLSNLLTAADLGGTWTNPSGINHTGIVVPDIDASGDYTYTVIGDAPCPNSSTTVAVQLLTSPNAGIGSPLDLCNNSTENVQLFENISSGDAGGQWTDPTGNPSDGLVNPSTSESGSYTYTASEATGFCPDVSTTVLVSINNIPSAGQGGEGEFCYNHDSSDLYALVTEGTEGGEWISPNGTVHGGELDPSFDITGTYTYNVYSPTSQNCKETTTVSVIINPLPEIIAIDTLTNGQITVEAEGQSDLNYYLNDQEAQTSAVFNGLSTGEYLIAVEDNNSCKIDELIAITVFELVTIPTLFTPNGDGINDVWEIEGAWQYPRGTVYIYDRHGKLMSEYSASENGWDGKYNGAPARPDTYWYVVRLSAKLEFVGHVTLKQ